MCQFLDGKNTMGKYIVVLIPVYLINKIAKVAHHIDSQKEDPKFGLNRNKKITKKITD